MKLAIPVWEGRVSPVFDTARKLLVMELCDGREVERGEWILPEGAIGARVALLKEGGIQTLVCGAISRPLADMISHSGVELIPFVAGDAEEVIRAYLAGELPGPAFFMPGCCGGRRRRGGRRFGGRMRGGRV